MRDSYRAKIDAELSRWPGVKAVFSNRRKHRQVRVHYEGRDRFVVYPVTPSDSRCGVKNAIQNLRAELRGLGALRT